MRFLLILMLLATTIVSGAAVENSPKPSEPGYKLAPGDRIAVTVYGQADLSGDYLIDGAGEVHLPLMDSIRVGSGTLDDARRAITDRLAEGLLKNPTVSVRVSEYRPVYILGDVRTPGSFPFRFGMTGMSAIALAGGIGRADLGSGSLTDIVNAEERVKILARTRLALLVRLARLAAERSGASTFDFANPEETVGDDEVAKMVDEELEQMRVLRQAHEKSIALFDRQRPQIQAEIDTTREQIKVEQSQLALIRKNLDEYNTLVKRGLGRTTTTLDFQRQAADREGIISRLKGDLARLETKLGDLDIRGQDAENTRQIRIATDMRELKTKLSELEVQLPSAQELLELRRQQAGSTVENDGVSRTHRVTLTRAGKRRVILASGDDVTLEPGDIVEVNRLKSDLRRTGRLDATSALPPPTGTSARAAFDTPASPQ